MKHRCRQRADRAQAVMRAGEELACGKASPAVFFSRYFSEVELLSSISGSFWPLDSVSFTDCASP